MTTLPSASPTAQRAFSPRPTPDTGLSAEGLRLLDTPRASPLALLGVPLRLLLGAIFIWAFWTKLGALNGPSVFASSILAYKLPFPEHMVQLSTFAVPYTELVAGLLLIAGLFTRGAALVTAALLLTFIALQSSALLRGLDIKCGCFGERTLLCTGGISACHIIQNIVLFAMALTVALTPRTALALDNVVDKFKRHWNA
jgi:uncharacterized membrane protein YphA (DoxX/SURF4 family)